MISDRGPELVEAARYVELFRDRIVVIKLGGELLQEDGVVSRLLPQIEVLYRCGLRPILVHGGGIQVDRRCEELGLSFAKRDGRRATSKEVLDVLLDLVGGELNRSIVGQLSGQGVPARGYRDGLEQAIRCRQRPPSPDAQGMEMDWGFVGDLQSVDATALLGEQGADWIVPVLPSLGVLDDGQPVNVNADSVASGVAIGTQAAKLVLLTGVAGVMPHRDAAGPVSQLRSTQARACLEDGTAQGGMRAKIQEALRALDAGVPRVHIISGRAPHTLLREIFTNEGCGTLLLPDDE